MEIAVKWLKELLPLEETAEEIADKLSVSGLEVEGILNFESVKGALKGIVIGEVLTCAKHPNADKLSITTVNIGQSEASPIVCGAPNVAAGQKVLVATIGTQIQIPGKEPLTIGEAKIRGEISRGMICAEDEIGLGNAHDGILVLPADAPVGMAADKYFGIYTDQILEIGLTANRGDAASHLGVARDLAALLDKDLKYNLPVLMEKQNYAAAKTKIAIESEALCKRFVAIEINNITNQSSPAILANRLKSIGIEPKNLLVDVTNYVLHETGQPIHAYSADKLHGDLTVRMGKAQEKLVLLDGKEIELNPQALVIASGDKPVGLAGVFGGKETGIREDSNSIVIESACFAASLVRKTAKLYTLSTDAAFRFERGTDVEMCKIAAFRAAELILQYGGGEISGVSDVYPKPFQALTISLSKSYLHKISGIEIPVQKVEQILSKLGFGVTNTQDGWEVSVPAYKNDVSVAADLAEEILRIYGYDNIPFAGSMQVSMSDFGGLTARNTENKARNLLVATGFFEAANNSLVSENDCKWISDLNPVSITNPLSSDLGYMRTNLLSGLLKSVAYNRNRKQMKNAFFEFGRIYYVENGEIKEENRIGVLLSGPLFAESWEKKPQTAQALDLREKVQNMLKGIGFSEATMESTKVQKVSADILKKFDIQKAEVWYYETNWDKILDGAKTGERKVIAAPKFPAMRRDLSLVLEKNVKFTDVEMVIQKVKPAFLQDYLLFDVYTGDKLEDGKKAWAIGFQFRSDDRTLTDMETDGEMQKLISGFEKDLQALIRR